MTENTATQPSTETKPKSTETLAPSGPTAARVATGKPSPKKPESDPNTDPQRSLGGSKARKGSGKGRKEKPSTAPKSLGKVDSMMLFPEEVTILGLDVGQDANGPKDPRIKMDPPDHLVQSILALGVINPVTVREEEHDGKKRWVVLAGRQRVRAARCANLVIEQSKKGSPLHGRGKISIPCIVEKCSDLDATKIMIVENEHRTDDTPINRARKAADLMSRNGGDLDDAAMVFGVNKQTIRNYLSLLEASSKVQRAVESGKISPTAGYELAKIKVKGKDATLKDSHDAQDEALEEMLTDEGGEGGKVRGSSGKAAKKSKAKRGDAGSERPSMSEIKDAIERKLFSAAKIEVLRWVTGEIGFLDAGGKEKSDEDGEE